MTGEGAFAPWVEPIALGLRATRDETVRRARALTAGDLARATGNAGWSVRDELVHIAASEGDFVRTLGAIVGGEVPDTSVFADIDARNAHNLAAWRDQPMDAVADELADRGRDLQALLARLSPEDERRQPAGLPFALGQLVGGYAQHEPYHLRQIREAVGDDVRVEAG